jgi:hypothetical protein
MLHLAHIFKALSFAAHAHREQRRKGTGEPYVNHLIEVAELLTRVAGVEDVDVLRAAVLHDVIEDTGASAEELELVFGQRVRALVEALTDDKSLATPERKRLQIEHMRSAEADARLIKLADHCSNIAVLPVGWSTQQRTEYLDWSERVANVCFGTCPALDSEYRERLGRARAKLKRDAVCALPTASTGAPNGVAVGSPPRFARRRPVAWTVRPRDPVG